MSVSEPLLQMNGVTHRYGESEWDLSVPDFALWEGEVVGVLGPNGSGKSTLLRIAAGVLEPVSGTVTLGGRDVSRTDRREVARSMGYLPQTTGSLFDYTAEEVVRMGRYPHLKGLGILDERDVEAVERAFRLTETDAFGARRLSHLSGGERQRVFLASVLAQEPRMLLLDEPTSALDIHHQARFFALLGDLARGGMGVCVVTHDVNLASLYCGRLVMLSEGRIMKEGAADDIIEQTLLRSVYGEGLVICSHPELDRPIVLPSGGPALRHAQDGAVVSPSNGDPEGREREVVVHRKGATPAGEGVIGIIPGSMATPCYVARGKGSPESLDSAAHGAGRKMSRKRAKKLFTWKDARAVLAEGGVTLISAGLDEVPMAYKDIDEVMAAQADLVEPVARFDPKLVKMAPG